MKIERRGSLTVLLLAGLTGGVVGSVGCTEEPSPTPTPPQRPGNRLVVHPTPTPQGFEGVTFPSQALTPTVESKPELPPGWKPFKSEDLLFRIAIPSSWVPIEDSYGVPKSTEPKIAERFLGDIVEGGAHSALDISALRVGLFNDEGEWTTLEDFIAVKLQELKYHQERSIQKEEEIVNTGYWPRTIDGSRAWFLEIHKPFVKVLDMEVIFIKHGRLWTIAYLTPYENSWSGYLEEKRKLETLVDFFRSP